MRLWDDLLATAQGMASSGSVGDASHDALEPPRRSRRDRLVEGLARLGNRGGTRGGEKTGPNPTDRGKQGSKRHLLVDRDGIPLAVRHTAANVHDSNMLEAVLDAVSPIRRPHGRPGRPRKRPESYTLTRATTSAAAERRCASGASSRASVGVGSTQASA